MKTILSRHVPNYEVRAFGSRVGRIAKKYSDLDLVVMSDIPIPPRVMALLKDDFSESNLPFKVDVLDWATVSDNFRKTIEKRYMAIQLKKNDRKR